MGKEGVAALATTCSSCCTVFLGIAYTVVMIIAVVQSSQDNTMLDSVSAANTYYVILPIISIIIPNPITSGIIAFTDCSEFKNCDESYRDLYRVISYKLDTLYALFFIEDVNECG